MEMLLLSMASLSTLIEQACLFMEDVPVRTVSCSGSGKAKVVCFGYVLAPSGRDEGHSCDVGLCPGDTWE